MHLSIKMKFNLRFTYRRYADRQRRRVCFSERLNQLPKLGPNQLAILLFQVLQTEPLQLIALFRSTLESSFQLNDLVVLVLSGDQLVARKTFTIEEVPVLLPKATLPLWLDFSEEEQFVELSTS